MEVVKLHRAPSPRPQNSITAATLLAWGAHDRLAPLQCAEAWCREIPGATLRVFDDSGHVPHIEEPDGVAAAVTEFCGGREGRR